MRRLLGILLLFVLSMASLSAQLPTATYSDSFKFDALKVDISKAGFKVQLQIDVQTATWLDVPALSLGTPVQLIDTRPDSLTFQLPISPSTPAGERTVFIRYCATSTDPLVKEPVCSVAASIRFLLRASDVIGAPSNLRFGPKGGGTVADLPGVVSQKGYGR